MISVLRVPPGASGPAAWMWIGLIAVASIWFSRAFACATPFAALATLAVLTLRGKEALALVSFVWLANQAIGFGLLHYPWTASTFAWGLAIGIAALGGLAAASQIVHRVSVDEWPTIPLALAAAFAAYEAVLYAASLVLPSGAGAFAPAVMLRILGINAVALVLLLAAHRLARATTVRLVASPL